METYELSLPQRTVIRKDGRDQARKTVGDDKTYNIGSGSIAAGSITQSLLASNSVGKAQFKYQVVAVSISLGTATGTASVTSGAVILGFQPNSSDQSVKTISISGTTLTVTLNANTGLNPAVVNVIVINT